MTDLKFSLERSTYFNNRSKLLASNGVPKLSDAKSNLGNSLAKVVFEQCEDALREDFGLKNPLNGPGDILWVSPSDLLIGKVALKPPFTPKCLQALTHKGILEIGEDLEKRFRQEMELDKQKTLEKYKAELLASVEVRMKSEIKDIEIRERLNCHMEMEKQEQEFELILKDELDKLENKIREEYEKIINKNEEQLKQEWKERLQKEVENTVEELTRKFLAQIDEQEEKLTNAFRLELRKKEILRDFDAKLHKSSTNDMLRTLKHNLECRNLVNMMYILCTERRKCCDRKQEIESYYQNIISEQQKKILQQDNKINKLTKEKEHQIQEVQLRETCLREVIKHFQKFINFALRAAPTQAEFLLSVEKMMVFELTNLVAKSEFPKAQIEKLIIPWNFEYTPKTPCVTSNLEISDHHNCLNELNPPTPKNGSEIGEDRDLPAMYFNNKMYVREDFRDMLSTGIEIRPSNEIWNKDVEILIENLRTLSTEAVEIKSPEDESSKDESEEDQIIPEKNREDIFSICNTERRRSKQSTVQFIDAGITETRRRSGESKKASRKSSLRPAVFPLVEIEPTELEHAPTSASNILAARDSLEVIIEKKQKSGVYLNPENVDHIEETSYITVEDVKISNAETGLEKSVELVIETRDSVILRKSLLAKHQSSAEFNISPKDSIEIAKYTLDKAFEVKSKPSKLISTRNSVELLRESLSKLREPPLICQRKDQQQNTSSPIFGFSETCCEHCKRKDSLNILSDIEEPKEGYKILKPDSFSDEKSVKISRVQVINLDEHITAPSVVSFHTEPKIYNTTSSDSSSKRKKSARSATGKKCKRNSPKDMYKLKIIGDQHAKEGEQSNDEFTADRIHSLISLMKDHPQLMQLFTGGSR